MYPLEISVNAVSYVQNVDSRLVSELLSHTVSALLLYGGNGTQWEV